MSVLKYTNDIDEIEDEIENEIEEENKMTSNTTITMQPPKLRIAVCGPAKSGKTHLLNAIEESYLARFENPLRHYMHMNKSLAHGLSNFEFTTDAFAVQTRDYLAECGTESCPDYYPDAYLRTCLDELNDHDLILVEDVRHYWEYEVLKQYGFLILYMSTPNDMRHKRSTDITERNFMWTKHEMCLTNIKWDYNDAYVTKSDTEHRMKFDLVVNHTGPFGAQLWELLMNRVIRKSFEKQ